MVAVAVVVALGHFCVKKASELRHYPILHRKLLLISPGLFTGIEKALPNKLQQC